MFRTHADSSVLLFNKNPKIFIFPLLPLCHLVETGIT